MDYSKPDYSFIIAIGTLTQISNATHYGIFSCYVLDHFSKKSRVILIYLIKYLNNIAIYKSEINFHDKNPVFVILDIYQIHFLKSIRI